LEWCILASEIFWRVTAYLLFLFNFVDAR
jgi:hypothetical protein